MTDAATFAAEFTANILGNIAKLEALDTANKWVVAWDNGLCVRVGQGSATSALFATTFASERDARAEYSKCYTNGKDERAKVRIYADLVAQQLSDSRDALALLKEMGHA